MLEFINNITHPILDYVIDDPVRPSLSKEFRVSKNRFISAIIGDTPKAIVCVSLHDIVPKNEQDLIAESTNPNIAVFYTIWSYAPGAGADLLLQTVNEIKNRFPSIHRVVTLSPKTAIARRFHLKNGATVFRENENTINYEYKI